MTNRTLWAFPRLRHTESENKGTGLSPLRGGPCQRCHLSLPRYFLPSFLLDMIWSDLLRWPNAEPLQYEKHHRTWNTIVEGCRKEVAKSEHPTGKNLEMEDLAATAKLPKCTHLFASSSSTSLRPVYRRIIVDPYTRRIFPTERKCIQSGRLHKDPSVHSRRGKRLYMNKTSRS